MLLCIVCLNVVYIKINCTCVFSASIFIESICYKISFIVHFCTTCINICLFSKGFRVWP